MSPSVVLGVIGSGVIMIVLFELLRRRHLREKYAVLWFMVALGALTITIFPGLLDLAARAAGVDDPADLLFFAAMLVLTLQHSFELGRLEERSRTLAEELGLLRLELDQRRAAEEPAVPEDPSGVP